MSQWDWILRESYTVILKISGDQVSIDKHVPPQIQGNLEGHGDHEGHEKDPPPLKKRN